MSSASHRARHVLKLIDQAELIRERNPTLWAAQIRAGEKTGRDRTVVHLASAVNKLKRRQVPSKAHVEHDDVERVDPKIEEAYARRAEEHDRGRRLKNTGKRKAQREQMDALALHHLAVQRAAVFSTVRAGNIEPSRAGAETAFGAPLQQLLDDDTRYLHVQDRLKRSLMTLHEILDEYEGLGTTAINVAQMDGIDKDNFVLREGEGLTVRQFIDEFGRVYGGETYIRELRRRENRDRLGHRLDR